MKKLLLISVISAGLFVSCDKFNFLKGKDKNDTDKNEKKCPTVAANLVPLVVKDSFHHRYPSDTVKIWFNKDSVAYCAYFISSGIEKLAQFSNSGNFVKEELETEVENDHEDSTAVAKPSTGCECEIPDKD